MHVSHSIWSLSSDSSCKLWLSGWWHWGTSWSGRLFMHSQTTMLLLCRSQGWKERVRFLRDIAQLSGVPAIFSHSNVVSWMVYGTRCIQLLWSGYLRNSSSRMASARRPRTSFRPVTKSTEGGTDREEDAGEKSKQRVRTEILNHSVACNR